MEGGVQPITEAPPLATPLWLRGSDSDPDQGKSSSKARRDCRVPVTPISEKHWLNQ